MNNRKIALVTRLHDPCMSSAVCGERTGLRLLECLSVDRGGQPYVGMPSPICLAVEGCSRHLGARFGNQACTQCCFLLDFEILLKSMGVAGL